MANHWQLWQAYDCQDLFLYCGQFRCLFRSTPCSSIVPDEPVFFPFNLAQPVLPFFSNIIRASFCVSHCLILTLIFFHTFFFLSLVVVSENFPNNIFNKDFQFFHSIVWFACLFYHHHKPFSLLVQVKKFLQMLYLISISLNAHTIKAVNLQFWVIFFRKTKTETPEFS